MTPIFIRRLKKIWPFSIKAYALTFIILMSLIFGFFGWGMQLRLDAIRKDATVINHNAAQEEIHHVLNHITEEVLLQAEAIVNQDETRQQFINADYYHYWRDHRIIGGGILPIYAQGLELYTKQGKSLTTNTKGDMPKQLPTQDFSNFFARMNGQVFYFIFHPVISENGNKNNIQGYLGIKVNILDALKDDQRFYSLNIDTLTFNVNNIERIPLEQFYTRIQFELTPNAENMALTASIERHLRQLLFSLIALYLMFYLLLTSILSAPLRHLSMHIDLLRKGQGGLLSKSYTRGLPLAELENVRISLNDYQNKLEEMHLSLSEKNDELWQLAHHDPLTGIYNRRGFDEDWKHILSVSSGHRLGVALILFDCDHFKAINDTYGHPTGDLVIQAIAHTLQQTLRHGDRLYRMGGDEFASLFIDTDAELALHTAERCINAVSQYDFTSLGIKEPVRISAGMAYAIGTDTELLLNLPKQADVAMYHAKRPGKRKIAVYDPDMIANSNILFSTSVNHLVFEAMENDAAIEMHYQPIVNLNTGQVDYYEALVRIRNGNNLILPSTIFPIINERRIEAEFDRVVIARIAKDLAAGKIPACRGVAINVSGPGVIDPLVQEEINGLAIYLKQYKLIIEVTETALITQLHLASNILNKMRQNGFKIALDDFGSGYSSLSYLSNMPVDIVKFDISLIRQLVEGNRQSLIIENLATMVLKAGYTLVAEGVEDRTTLKKITEIGFNFGQGFLLGRPDNTCREAELRSLL